VFYSFRQNNSGGHFVRNKNVDGTVIIEADDEKSAIYRAYEVGIYFNGVSEGMDCECCGDRWSEPYDDGDEVPSHYSTPLSLEDVSETKNPRVHTVVIHYQDGRVVYTNEKTGDNDEFRDYSLRHRDESEYGE
jgi:hypothetical protein